MPSLWKRNYFFKISDIEKLFGCTENNQITRLIIITLKDVIHQKIKKGNKMTLGNVKKGLLRKLEYV